MGLSLSTTPTLISAQFRTYPSHPDSGLGLIHWLHMWNW